MKKQGPTAIEIKVLAPSTLSAPDERCEPVSLALLDQESEDHDEPCRKNLVSSR